MKLEAGSPGAEKPRAKESPEKHDDRRPQMPLAEVAQYFPGHAEEHVSLGVVKRYAEQGSCLSSVSFGKFRTRLQEAGWIEQDPEYRWRRSKLGDELVFSWKNSNTYQQGATNGSEQ